MGAPWSSRGSENSGEPSGAASPGPMGRRPQPQGAAGGWGWGLGKLGPGGQDGGGPGGGWSGGWGRRGEGLGEEGGGAGEDRGGPGEEGWGAWGRMRGRGRTEGLTEEGWSAVLCAAFSRQMMHALHLHFHFYKPIFSSPGALNQRLAPGLQLIGGNAATFPL